MNPTERRMAVVLCQMTVISEQPARSYDGVTVHGGERSHEPHLLDTPMLDYWQARFNRATTPAAQQQALIDTERALELARRTPIPEGQQPEYGSPQWKRWIAQSKEPSKDLARRFNVSSRYINRIRQDWR